MVAVSASNSNASQVLLLCLLVFSTFRECIVIIDAFAIAPKTSNGRSSYTTSSSYRYFQKRNRIGTRRKRCNNDVALGSSILRAKKFASISTDGDGDNNSNNVRFTGSLGKPSRSNSNNKTTQKNNAKSSDNSTMSKKERQRTANGTIDSNSNNSRTTTNANGNPADQAVQVVKGNRGNKTVTIIRGMNATSLEEKKKILKHIKSKMGVGGTLVDGVLEIQGSHAEKVVEMLKELGYAKARQI